MSDDTPPNVELARDVMRLREDVEELEQELRELVEGWRDEVTPTNTGGEEAARNHALMDCADDLEALLDDD